MEEVELVSTPPPHSTKGLNLNTVVVCGTLVALFVIAGTFYLDVRNSSSMALTQLTVNVLAAIPGLLAFITAQRAKDGLDVVAQQTNGTLRRSQQLATRALGALPPHRAEAITREVVGTSPADDPPGGTLPLGSDTR